MPAQPTAYDLIRTGTTTGLSIDLNLAQQTLADGTVLSGVTRINFRGGEGADTVYGGAYDDVLVGAGGADVLDGRDGADLLIGGLGDTLRGGLGNDTVEISAAPLLVDGGDDVDLLRVTGSLTFAAGSVTGFESVEVARAVVVNFSNLTAGLTIGSSLTGSGGVNVTGTRGNDIIVGSASADTLDGSNGDDLIYGGDGNDKLTSGPGTDFLYGEGGDDVMESKRGTGPDHFDGGAGTDRVVVDLAKTSASLSVDLTDPSIRKYFGDGGSIINVEQIAITGGTGADTFTGGALADTLAGYDGDDVLKGAGGNDAIDGGAGFDRVIFSGARSSYQVTQQASGALTITDLRAGSPDGVDTVTTVESFQFADGLYTATSVLATTPPSLGLSSAVVAENLAAGAAIGDLSVTNGAGPYTYSLLDNGSGAFALSGATIVTTGALDFEAAATRQVTVRATGSGGSIVDQTLTITVADQNDAPTDVVVTNSSSVAEDTTIETRVADLAVVDPDTNLAFRDNVLSADDTRFEVKNGSLYLKAGQSLDFEAGASIAVGVTVNAASGVLHKTVNVSVRDVNEAPSDINVSNLTSLIENTALATKLADVSVLDPDSKPGFLDNVLTVDDVRFEVVNGGLYLKPGQVIDYEAGSTITLTLTATSAAGVVNRAINLNVVDVNENVATGVQLTQSTVSENASLGAVVGQLAHSGGGSFAYSLVDDAGGAFVLSGDQLLVAGPLDFESGASRQITVRSVEDGGAPVDHTFTVDLINQDEAPTDIGVSNLLALTEGVTSPVRVADLSVADPDLDPAFLTNVVSVDDARFEIKDGGLYLKADQIVEFDAGATIPLLLTATSASGATVQKALNVTVTDVNNAPTAILISNVTALAENTTSQTKVADIALVDPDTDPAFLDNVLTVDDARFEIKDGGVYLKAGQVVDFETQSSILLNLTATSSAGVIHHPLTITVTDVVEGPPAAYQLYRAGTAQGLTVDLGLVTQTLADGTVLDGVKRIDFKGGEGADTVYGGVYDDTLAGNGGADLLEGRGGNDLLLGGAGDTLRGGEGDDVIEINGAAALVDGGAGADLVRITASATLLASSITNVETVEIKRGTTVSLTNLTSGLNITSGTTGASGISLVATKGDDVIVGSALGDTIDGNNGNDIIHGGAGNDRLTSGQGTDYLYGDDGDDVMESKRGTGPDFFDGGAGVDRLVMDLAKASVALHLDITDTTVRQYFGDGGYVVNVEQIQVTGGTAADVFVGGALADSLGGYDGDDVLKGAGGNDIISGGNGYDTAVFAGASDSYTVVLQSDGSYKVTSAAEGVDTLTSIENLRFADGDRPITGYVSNAVYWGSGDGSATLVRATNIPDGRGATPGTGFTITGLTQASDGTWWGANEGQSEPDDTTYTPSLVHMSADLTTKLGEINLPSAVRAVQGIAYKASTNEIFVGSLSERLIRVYSSDGVFLRSFAPSTGTSVNGLAYDAALDAVVIGHEAGNAAKLTVEWRSATTGALIKTLNIANQPDQLFVDSSYGTQGALYYTYGDSGAGRIGYVVKVDIATGEQLGSYALSAADAIEGVVVVDGHMWVANDAYFHRGDPSLSRVLEYDITPIAYQMDVRSSATALTINLNQTSQLLANGVQLVGVERIFFHGGSGADTVTGGDFADVIVGGEGADVLVGGGGDDRLVGADGDDVITGGAGNDDIEGGAGTDRVIFEGSRALYQVTKIGATGVIVTDLRTGVTEGVDTVRDVETFQFSDGTFNYAQVLTAPVVNLSLSSSTVAEDATVGRVIGAISASNTGLYTYSLLNNADGLFSIVGNQLVVNGPLDFENASSLQVTVRAIERGGAIIDRVFTVNVTDVNEAPIGLSVTNRQVIVENTTQQTQIATLIVRDQDLNDAFNDNIVTVDDPRFEIIGSGLYLKAGQSIDFEAAETISLVLTVTSSAGIFQRSVTFRVGDVDESPISLTVGPVSPVSENTAAETRLADVTLAHAADGALVTVDDARFAVHDGGLYLKAGQALDYEAAASLTLHLSAAGTSGPLSQDVTVTVVDQNDAPTDLIVSNLAALAENTATETKLADLAVIDADLNPAFLDNVVSVDDSRFEIKNGALFLKAGQAVDFEATPQIALQLTVTSAAGTIQKSVTLTVGDVEEAPVSLTVGPVSPVSENTAAETRLADVTLAHAADGALVTVDDARFAVHDGGLYLKAGQALDYEAAASLTLHLSAAGTSGPLVQDVTVTVVDQNDAPTDLIVSNLAALAENTATETKLADLAVIDADLNPAFLDNVVSVDDSRFEIKNGALFLKAGQVVDFEATPQIALQLTVTSAAGTIQKSVTITVGDVEEAPISLAVGPVSPVSENTAAETRLADVTLAHAADGALVTVDDARFAVHDGGLYLKAGQALDFEAAASLTLHLSAAGTSGPLVQDVTVTVVDQNDAPTDLIVSNLAALAENTATETKLADLAVIDADLNPAFLDNVVSVDDSRFEIKNGALFLKAGQVVDFEATPQIALQLTVTSAAGTIQKSVTLTVGDVEDAPISLTVGPVSPVSENTATETRLADVTLAHAADGALVTVDDARFAVHDGGLYLNAGQALDYEAAASLTLHLSAAGTSGPLVQDVTVTVVDQNDAPTDLIVSNLAALAENTATQTKLADLAVIDADLNPAFLDNLVSVSDSRFEVLNGALYLKAGQIVDYETASTIALTLTATSSAGAISKGLVINVTDVLEGPPPAYVLNRAGTAQGLTVDAALVSQTLADGTILGNIQRIDFRGGEGADTVYGGAFDDILTGNGGADILDGRGGDDLIFGGLGDTLRGGQGNDTISVSGLPTLIDGGVGQDLVKITGAMTFAADSIINVEQLEVARGLTVNFGNLVDGLTIVGATTGSTAGVTITGTRGNDNLTGTSGADVIDGSNGNDVIHGGGGNDRLTSGPGTDYLYGDDGDDVLESKRGTGPDYFDGGAGVDRVNVDLAKVTAALTLDLTNPALKQFFGDGGWIINVEQITITGGTGADNLTGGALADAIDGYTGNDIIRGGGGADTLNGGAGVDIIDGGTGNDVLTGGLLEKDTFVYSAKGWGADHITDFENGLDVLDFRGAGLTAAEATISQVGANTVINFGVSGSITLDGVTASSVHLSDWLF